jgi:predicted anti-sigma-YlaC factor YlaD
MKSEVPICEQVRMAAMARLDGEHADLTPSEVETHVAGCAECRAAVAALTALHTRLDEVDYEALDVDMWPGVRRGIAPSAAPARPESRFVLALAAMLALWRLAQLSLDLPAPVVNSVVPLALMVLVLWRIVGDPFAIQVTANQLQREGVR